MDITRKDFLRAGAYVGAAIAAGEASAHKLSETCASETHADPLSFVDPELRPALVKLLPEIEKEVYTPATLAQMRILSRNYAPKPLPDPPFEEQMVPGGKGQPDVRVYIINRKKGGAPRGAILHIHGGGYILGAAQDAVPRMQALSKALDCLCVTVDYRLAPEARYPQSIEDNYAALRWLHRNAAALGIDPRHIAVMGESAGGGHAAMLVNAAHDRGEFPICFQALTYPMLDDRTGSTKCVPPWIGAFMWKPESNVFGWTSLLGRPAGSPAAQVGAVPARRVDLSGLPPTYIAVGSIDLFVEEDIEYARRLTNAGVPTQLHVFPGAYHGFDELVPEAACSILFKNSLHAALRRALTL